MATVTLLTLRTDAYKACDQQDQKLCPPAEVTRYINAAIKKLRDFLTINNVNYFQKSGPFTVSAATGDTYGLPADFHKCVNVFWDAGVGRLLRMEECPPNEDEFTVAGVGWNYDYKVRYELLVGNIRFIPAPTGTYTVTLKYVPTFVDLAADGDTVELYNGWEEWVTLDAASRMAGKEESDGTRASLRQERDECGQRILALAKRNSGEPRRVQDVYKPVGRWYS